MCGVPVPVILRSSDIRRDESNTIVKKFDAIVKNFDLDFCMVFDSITLPHS